MQELVRRYAETVFRSHGVFVQIRVGLNSGGVVVRAIGSDLHMDCTAVGQTRCHRRAPTICSRACSAATRASTRSRSD
jgi:class 3 adenylate cyclase